MKSLVVYVTHKGNTQRVAETIGEVLRQHGTADVLPVDEAPSVLEADVDLFVLGGPTEGHGMTPEQRAYLDRLDASTFRGRAAAAFDTRINWPRLLSGSAADGIAKRLREIGARVIEPEGSFIVNTEPALLDGELQRAATWAAEIAAGVELAATPA
jgi:flavodoxin